MNRFERARLQRLRKNSDLPQLLGGAELQRSGKGSVLNPASAAEGRQILKLCHCLPFVGHSAKSQISSKFSKIFRPLIRLLERNYIETNPGRRPEVETRTELGTLAIVFRLLFAYNDPLIARRFPFPHAALRRIKPC